MVQGSGHIKWVWLAERDVDGQKRVCPGTEGCGLAERGVDGQRRGVTVATDCSNVVGQLQSTNGDLVVGVFHPAPLKFKPITSASPNLSASLDDLTADRRNSERATLAGWVVV